MIKTITTTMTKNNNNTNYYRKCISVNKTFFLSKFKEYSKKVRSGRLYN